MEIKEAQTLVDNWIKDVGVRYFSELTNMAMLTEEVGEVARIIARRYGEQSEKESDKNKDLGDELADVLFVLICLANQTGVDLEKALKKNLVKKTKRDKTRHLDNEKLLPYQKVSCDFYDEIETYAALRKKVIITYQKQSEDLVLKSTIKGLKTTKEKEEFLILPDNTMIRLDHVVRILEV